MNSIAVLMVLGLLFVVAPNIRAESMTAAEQGEAMERLQQEQNRVLSIAEKRKILREYDDEIKSARKERACAVKANTVHEMDKCRYEGIEWK